MLFLPAGLPVVLPDQTEAVLLGAAVLGACASQDYSSIQVNDTWTQKRSNTSRVP